MGFPLQSRGLVSLTISGFFVSMVTLNCAKVGFSKPAGTSTQTASSTAPAPVDTTDQTYNNEDSIEVLCKTRPHETAQQAVYFANSSEKCPWEQGDNLGKNRGYITARVEQIYTFGIPAGATLCETKFTAAPQSFRFDDAFMLALNGHILASSIPKALEANLQKSTPYQIPIYDWKLLAGKLGEFGGSEKYCAGMKEGLGQCEWPLTETTGPISFTFDPALIRAIGVESQGNPTQELRLATFGDNDDGNDCRHTPLSFTISLSYVR